ncbi:hypothetical protein CP533_0507 [Ophiocordyceps camponoti-saundersi (nom. inval.)]|nr:hypothetical protein CP533_0507 [Ophiocordyceps camponoti-saundersi (nom. inval.)]
MSRVTAPVVKLSRALGTTSAAAPSGAASAHGAGAALLPKYAELLRNRRSGEVRDQASRGITTTHRPTPQPSLANRTKPLMQTFRAAAHNHTASSPATAQTLDATVIPNLFRYESLSSSYSNPRVPILPDNYSVGHGPFVSEDPVRMPEVSIVAADPENVLPGAPLSGVDSISLDGVELKFAHEHLQSSVADEVASGGMIRDLWRSMVDDVFGPVKKN